MAELRFAGFAAGRPYHAALVPITESSRRSLPHAHADFHELLHVTHGRAWQQIVGERQDLSSGDLVLVRPQDAHEFGMRRDGEFQFINIAFPSEQWRSFADFAGVAAASAWDVAAMPLVVRGVGQRLSDAMERMLTAYQNTPNIFDLIGLWLAVLPILDKAFRVSCSWHRSVTGTWPARCRSTSTARRSSL